MCFFLTVGVKETEAENIACVFARGFQVMPSANPSITRTFPAGFAARLVTSGMCSCDLYRQPAEGDVSQGQLERELGSKYARRGWSKSKIERAVSQAMQSSSAAESQWRGLREDIVASLIGLCEAVGDVAVRLHWYEGNVDSEPVSVHRSMHVQLDEFRTKASELEPDELWILAR